MKYILIFAAIVGTAYAGVRTLSADEDARKLQQFQELCASGQVPESGQVIDLEDGRTIVYCKRSKERRTEERTVTKNYEGPLSLPQTVFVEPPPVTYTHRVLVNAKLGGGKTNVYVVPQEVKNNYDVSVKSDQAGPQKPTVVFLGARGGQRGGDLSSSASAPSPRISEDSKRLFSFADQGGDSEISESQTKPIFIIRKKQ